MSKEIFKTIRESLEELEINFNNQNIEKEELERKVTDLEEQIEDEKNSLGEIKSIDKIKWSASNLQDINTMEALEVAITKHGSLKVMKILESVV